MRCVRLCPSDCHGCCANLQLTFVRILRAHLAANCATGKVLSQDHCRSGHIKVHAVRRCTQLHVIFDDKQCCMHVMSVGILWVRSSPAHGRARCVPTTLRFAVCRIEVLASFLPPCSTAAAQCGVRCPLAPRLTGRITHLVVQNSMTDHHHHKRVKGQQATSCFG